MKQKTFSLKGRLFIFVAGVVSLFAVLTFLHVVIHKQHTPEVPVITAENNFDWKQTTVFYDGKELKLPVTVAEFTTVSGCQFDNTMLDGLFFNEYVVETASGGTVTLTIINTNQNPRVITECTVFGIATENAAELSFPANIHIFDTVTQEYIAKNLGDDVIISDNTFSYIGNPDSVAYEVSVQDGKVTRLSISNGGALHEKETPFMAFQNDLQEITQG